MSGKEGEVLVLVVVVLLFWVAPIIVAAHLSERRGRGVWLGIAFGIFGWIGVALLAILGPRGARRTVTAPARTRPCPSCSRPIAATDASCGSCGRDSAPWVHHAGHWWSRDDSGQWQYLDDSRGVWVSPRDGSARQAGSSQTASRGAAAAGGPFVGLDHVQVAAPPGREFDARRFYGGLLGLRELEKPPILAARGGCWFAVGGQALHVGVTENFQAATKAHPALRLKSATELDALAEKLGEAGYDLVHPDRDELPGSRRFFVTDPFGNRVEIIAPS